MHNCQCFFILAATAQVSDVAQVPLVYAKKEVIKIVTNGIISTSIKMREYFFAFFYFHKKITQKIIMS